MTARLKLLAAFLGVILLAIACLLAGDFFGLAAASLAAIFWLVNLRWTRAWAAHIAFGLNVLTAAYSIFAGAQPILALASLLSALAAWDLTRFSTVLEKVTPLGTARRLEILHLRRLGLSLGAGALAGLSALLIHFKLTFSSAAVLGLAAFVALALSINEIFGSRPSD